MIKFMHKNYRIAEPMDAHPDTLTQLARPHRKAVLVALLWITISGAFFSASSMP